MSNLSLGYNLFPLLNEANTNDGHRPGCMYLEYHEIDTTLVAGTKDVSVPTGLGTVVGAMLVNSLAADGKVVGAKAAAVANGASVVTVTSADATSTAKVTMGLFLIGTAKAVSTIALS